VVDGEEGLSNDGVGADSGATKHVFGNKDLLTDIKPLKTPVRFDGINGGSIIARYIGTFKFFDNVYYAPDAKANVISCSSAKDHGIKHGHIDETDEYFFEKEGERLVFPREGGMWVYRESGMEFCNLTQEQVALRFTKEQIERASRARTLTHRLGPVRDKDVYALAVHNSVDGFDGLRLEDFRNAETLWGPTLARMAGNSKEPKDIKIKIEPVFTFKKPVLDVYIDIMFIGGVPFLMSLTKPIGLIMANKLDARTAKCISRAILMQVLVLHKHQYAVRAIFTDGERGIQAAVPMVEKAGIQVQDMVTTHVPQAERAIQTLKSWVRGILVALPFKLPAFLAQDLVAYAAQRLNMLSSKRGFNGLSAIEALTGERVNLNIEARVAFGDYCQATIPNLGIQKSDVFQSRTEPVIALANKGRRGAVRFYSLNTGKRVVRTKFQIIPTPKEVIEQMNKLAVAKSMHPDEIIPVDDYDINADLNGLVVQEETITNNFDYLARDPEYADLMDGIPVPGESIADPAVRIEDFSTSPSRDSAEGVSEALGEALATQPEITKRYNTRGLVRDYRNIQKIYQLSVKKALQDTPEAAAAAIKEELSTLVKKNCFSPVTREQLDTVRRRKLIRSFMFLKEKLKPNGDFDKLKARLVANGSQQVTTMDEQMRNSSPTASLTSVFIIAAIAAKEKRHVVTVDVKSAYINARMPEEEVVDIIIEPLIAEELVRLAPEYASALRSDGSLVVNLKGALYGTQQAAKLWYLDISTFLIKLGFKPNENDCCVFNFNSEEGQLTVVLYVDDLKMTCKCLEKIEWLIQSLTSKYEEITINRGRVHHYLGMTFDYTDGLSISMSKYEDDLVETVKRTVSTPAGEDLFKINEEAEELNDQERKQFHTLVAKLQFMAKRTRPDILLPVAYLATRVQVSTVEDNEKLNRVLRYIKGNQNMQLTADPSVKEELLLAYTDASHAMHSDRISHTGAIVIVHGLPVSCSSKKQHAISLSSYEAELMALSEEAKEVIWCQSFLRSQTGFESPALLFCDNLGLVQSLHREKGSTHSNAKHIEIRYFWMREGVAKGSIKVEHVGTKEQLADFFTKPLQGEDFRRLRGRILRPVRD
jgi:hypothetical protein